jgi:hypothetical protein
MGELVDLERWRRDREWRGALAVDRAPDQRPDPAALGWVAVERDRDGRPVRWFHPGRIAQIGIVPNAPEWVFLDQDDRVRAWRTLDLADLVLAISESRIPDPEVTLRWDGTVVDRD